MRERFHSPLSSVLPASTSTGALDWISIFSCGSSPAGGGSLVSLLRGVCGGCVVVSEDLEAGGVGVGAGGDGEGLMR